MLGIGREGVHIAALSFRIEGVECEGGFAAAAQARDYDKGVPRDVQGNVLEIVGFCTTNFYVITLPVSGSRLLIFSRFFHSRI